MGKSYFLVEAYGTRTGPDYPDERALYSDRKKALSVFRQAQKAGVGARLSVIEVDRERERKALEGFIADEARFAEEQD